MTIPPRAVFVEELPEELNARMARVVLAEIIVGMRQDRPRVVLDLSKCREMTHPVAFVLLHTLEEAMKRNGDVRLSAGYELRQVLAAKEFGRLFDVFDTRDEAVKSFHRPLRETA
jgi:anti-anti-sigma regulatory factor